MIANNRYLYFTKNGTSYWLLWQQVGDFSSLHSAQLVKLAHDVLAAAATARPRSRPRLRPTPIGPPVYFAGDSTAAGPEWAWVTYFAGKATRTLSEYQVGSGLEVPGYFDWTKHLAGVALARRPKLVVYMGSANDGQNLFYKGTLQQVGSRGWMAAYGNLIGGLMSAVLRTGARLLVVGEPAMSSPSLSFAMAAVDEVDAAQARRHPGVVFFNPGSIFNGPGGSYRASVVIDRKPTEVRLDGIHFNIAGSVYLARYLAPIIERLLE